ncbi:hypothetical protein ACFXB3_16280 [Streptomyces sp. NPDC059447]|uniref:hypothetical protein n=1 Tax=unclassified Streptomyces TaxID=2593676 RepID=UPI0036A4DC30
MGGQEAGGAGELQQPEERAGRCGEGEPEVMGSGTAPELVWAAARAIACRCPSESRHFSCASVA